MISSLCFGQGLTSLDENLDMCPGGAHGPTNWMVFNTVPGTYPDGTWACDAAAGREGTPGITCSGLYGSPLKYHLDTSTLVSPRLDLSGYSDKVYVNFDTKTTNFNLGAKLLFIASKDSTALGDTPTTYNLSSRMMPPIGFGDETDWVTHQVDLTDYKDVVPLYIGFRYISADGTNGSRWYLDNIKTTTEKIVSVKDIGMKSSKISLTGSANGNTISMRCGVVSSGEYNLTLYDISGRLIHQEKRQLSKGVSLFALNIPNLTSGLYFVRLWNESASRTAKIPVL